jgi:hypothetical protein
MRQTMTNMLVFHLCIITQPAQAVVRCALTWIILRQWCLPLGVERFSVVALSVEDKWCPTELSEKQRDKVPSDGDRTVVANSLRTDA